MEKKIRKYRFLRRLARVAAVIILIFIAVILFIRSPWGQNILVNRAVGFISEKTGTRVSVDQLYITFSGNIFLEGLYMEDQKGDTLIYSKSLEASVALYGALFSNEIDVNSISWEGLRANINRKENQETYNFNFLIEAFAATDTISGTVGSEPMTVTLGSVDLESFLINFSDERLGIKSELDLGSLYLEMEELDLNDMRFRIKELRLDNTEISYLQTKPLPENNDTVPATLPFIAADRVSFTNVKANYISIPDGLNALVKIGDFSLGMPGANLPENTFEISDLTLQNSEFSIRSKTEDIPSAEPAVANDALQKFKWPDIRLTASNIHLTNNILEYRSGDMVSTAGEFNPRDIGIRNFSMQLDEASYAPEAVEVNLASLSFRERSGLMLSGTSFDLRVDDTSCSFTDFSAQTPLSALAGSAQIKYKEINEVIDSPETGSVELGLPEIRIDLRDLFYFQPQLAKNTNFKAAIRHKITGNLNAVGTLAHLSIPEARLHWGPHTELEVQGSLKDLTLPDSVFFDFPTIRAVTTREDLKLFLKEEDLGVALPDKVSLDASVLGTAGDMKGDARVLIPEGSVIIAADYQAGPGTFEGQLTVDTLQLGKLLKNEQLGRLSMNTRFDGRGSTMNDLDLNLTGMISHVDFRNYTFSDLSVNARLKDGQGTIGMKYKDANLDVALESRVLLDSVQSRIEFDLELAGADLQALGVTRDPIRAGLHLEGKLAGIPENFDAGVKVSEGLAVYDGNQYPLGNMALEAHLDPDKTSMTISSEFLSASLASNTSPDGLSKALKRQFKRYFEEEIRDSSTAGSANLHMEIIIRPTPIVTEVFFRDIKKLDSITAIAEYDEETGNVEAEIHIPEANYAGSAIDSLQISINGTQEDLNFEAGLSNLVFEPVQIHRTVFKGTLRNKLLQMDLNAMNQDEQLLHIASDLIFERDTLKLHVAPAGLVLNKRPWSIPADNLLTIAENYLGFHQMSLSQNSQKLEISNSIAGNEETHIGIEATDFSLQTFLSLLNPEEELATGQINGMFVIENPYGATGLLADFGIDSLHVLQVPLGRLSVKANSREKGFYDFNLALKDEAVDLDLKGDYAAATTGAKLNLELGINKLELKLLEDITGEVIKESHGIISGKIAVAGTTAEPEYEGRLEFDQLDFKVSSLNSRFKLTEEYLRLDTDGIYFENFEIDDANDHAFIIDGDIATEDLTNPSLDLSLVTEEFLVLCSKKEDNELFYGTASIDANMSVAGTLRTPEVEGSLKIRETTEVTYIVPESQLEIEEREGVVVFVNREEPEAILTRAEEEEAPAVFQGARIDALLEIADNAVFHIILDERSGDNLQVSGDAALNLNVAANDRVQLSGRYELNSGHYETSLYNLVKRRFDINPGSSITWQGDPMDARLDVTASYALETSASPLMTAITSGQDVSVTGKYRQVLPFLVYLHVDGELLKPELSFGLDMPEDAQGTFGGAVYSRVQQLNSQESELNKQVFSLLALNRFFPDSGSDGSGGGTAALARDNVNKVLSGELNAFSDKIFGKSGIELDFDLDSFTDYQGESPEDRTQLNINASKKLFDDRLIVTAGSAVDVEGSAPASQESTPIIGNVSLEYLLNEEGQYRLKGFRKNEYQNIIDGQLIVTGIAFIFNREFNKLSELFRPIEVEAPVIKEEGSDDGPLLNQEE